MPLLGATVPEPDPAAADSWPTRRRAAGWLLVNALAGGVSALLALTVVPTSLGFLVAPWLALEALPMGIAAWWLPPIGLLLPVHVDVHRAGDPAAVPRAVSREAYRIVQEGLTNALRHAGAVPVTVSATVGQDAVELELTNPLPGGRAGTRATGGRGFAGMRERVGVLRGELSAGPDGGRWWVSARLPRVLVLTTFGNDGYVYDALQAGATGFLLKRARPAEIVQAVRTVAEGESLLFPAAVRELIATRGAGGGDGLRNAGLTLREGEVLRWMARGLSNAEIARELVVGVETVKTHVGNVLAKLGARDRTQAVVAAYESGFIDPRRPVA